MKRTGSGDATNELGRPYSPNISSPSGSQRVSCTCSCKPTRKGTTRCQGDEGDQDPALSQQFPFQFGCGFVAGWCSLGQHLIRR
ncbi:hypothetical protein PUNSTDRAFT_121849 [Punctularia strigosozonata HHB-11173 SS5]|uniref:uncharacterized protein n=1 Tax=Punctularia strigosozonata (strain HHB-11173) TaxID=741275 RepID=UPI0004417DD3|nr:uncharacterized protein PUNSTDRAFT_121849 [Punctularia strigosozonata HHB-11173 SS5]EIN06744.1 hypothetical protein PUNSTDRAFT_121849 [Punctularia strigosozonata HHB-11173 SS5]